MGIRRVLCMCRYRNLYLGVPFLFALRYRYYIASTIEALLRECSRLLIGSRTACPVHGEQPKSACIVDKQKRHKMYKKWSASQPIIELSWPTRHGSIFVHSRMLVLQLHN